jgi:hypothetical protein
MISPQEIEAYAEQMAEPDFEMANIDGLIGHLDEADFDAVLARAEKISRETGDACLAAANALRDLVRLAHATGMPKGGQPVAWLQERGLIERVDDGFRVVPAKPTGSDLN